MLGSVIDIVTWILLLAGGAFVFIGGVGALRMPDLYTRMHAASLTDTLGTLLILLGLILQAGIALSTVKVLTIMLFLLLTAPTAAYALANAARLAGLVPERARHMDPE
jgi:multicomponent Na+:H+ antiporter subunit G